MADNVPNNEDYFNMAGVVYELTRGNQRGLYAAAARAYADRYPDRYHPPARTFMRVHTNALAYGNFNPPRPAHYEVRDNIHTGEILAAFEENPHTSSRAVAQAVGVCHYTVLNVLHKNEYHPYKVHLAEEDFGRRLEFATWALQQQPGFFGEVMFTDESSFSSDGVVNRHNSHYWSVENPHWMMERHHQGRWSINVWCGSVGEYVVGPHFFDGRLDGPTYADFIRNELPVLLEEVPLNLRRRMWFQQDGAPPHWFRDARAAVTELFGNKWIGRLGPEEQERRIANGGEGPIPWPPRSPDFSISDFFLWGYVKEDVYKTRPADPDELKDRIRQSIGNISPNVLRSLQAECLRRYQACVTVNGRHFEHLIDG